MVKIDSLKDFETSSRQTSARKGSLTLSQRPWSKRLKNDFTVNKEIFSQKRQEYTVWALFQAFSLTCVKYAT
jgi:hypothetical protein